MTPDPRLRARRVGLCVLVWSFFGILGGVSVFAKEFFLRRQITVLPAPTDSIMAIGGLVGHPVGLVVCMLVATWASSLIARGALDSRLKALSIATVVATLVFNGLFLLAVYLPISRVAVHYTK